MSLILSKSDCILFSIICLLLLIMHEFLFLKKDRDVSWLFFSINMIALAFFFMQESTLLRKPTLLFSILMVSSLLIFLCGYYTFGGERSIHINGYLNDSTNHFNLNRMHFLNRVGFVFYFIAFFYELSIAQWVFPAFAENKLLAYYNFPQNFVHYLVVSSIPITIIYAYLKHICKVTSKFDDVIIFIMLTFNVLILARAVFMTQLFMVIYFWFISKKIRLKVSYFIGGAIILLCFITIAGYFRTGDTLRVLLDIGGLSHWPDWMTPFAWPYLYFSTSIENFRNVFETQEPETVTYGFRTIMVYLLSLVQHKELIPYWGATETSAGGFNTFGIYLTAYYDYEFGFPVYFFILGVFTALLKNSSSISVRLFWPYWIYCIFTSPINDYVANFFTLVYMTYIISIVLASKKYKKI